MPIFANKLTEKYMRHEKLIRTFLLLMVSVFTITFTGCREKKVYKIGVSQCSDDDWRKKMNAEIQREMIFHDNAEVEIRSADDDSRKQIEDIRYFVDNGFDIIIVAPNEAGALTPVIKEVYESGMPIIMFDRNTDDNSYTAFQGADNKAIGFWASKMARALQPEGARVLEIRGLSGSTPAEDRHTGFAEGVDNDENLKIVGEAYGDWNFDDAHKAADSLLTCHPEANLVYAHNDRMAIAAAEVAKVRGRDDIKVIGVDAAPEIGIKAVSDGVIDATFLYPTEGYKLIRTAMSVLEGKPYDKRTILPGAIVDNSNAEILLMQNDELDAETGKVVWLKDRVDDYWSKYSSQKIFLYSTLVIIALLLIAVFSIIRAYWSRQRHQQELAEKNMRLEEQRDQLERQRDQLETQRDQMAVQRDQLEELNTQLRSATQSKLVFFTNVSHDLRTPLSLIAEPVEQLNGASNLTAEQNALMRIAHKNVKVLMRLINQILDFRKYENGKLDLLLTEVDFSRVIEDWKASFQGIADKREITFEIAPPSDGKPVNVAIDVGKMERVFYNLVSNAFKHTPDHGSIKISYRVEDGWLILSVADSGPGIEEGDLSHVFDRFFQTDKVHPDGSGIGLSVVKAFVELHEGSVSVESQKGKGAKFIVAIPIRHVSETPETVEKGISETETETELDRIEGEIDIDATKPLVEIVDDNPDVRVLLRNLLHRDYNVVEAENGSEGLRKAARYVPDLVVSDVMMPVMDGKEMCRRLKEETATSHIPVLMLTACAVDSQQVSGLDSGADAYLSKPFSSEVLLASVRSLIANRKRMKDLWQGAVKSPVAGEGQGLKAEDAKAGNIDSEFYRRFLEIFSSKMGDPEVSVDSLAGELGLERSQFYRKIKALTNYSPVELMRRLRLQKARQLLTATDRTVSEIGYETGFSTPAYFTKCYRDAFSETPTETRQKLKGNG